MASKETHTPSSPLNKVGHLKFLLFVGDGFPRQETHKNISGPLCTVGVRVCPVREFHRTETRPPFSWTGSGWSNRGVPTAKKTKREEAKKKKEKKKIKGPSSPKLP